LYIIILRIFYKKVISNKFYSKDFFSHSTLVRKKVRILNKNAVLILLSTNNC